MIRAQGEIDMRTTIALIALALIAPVAAGAAEGTANGTFTVKGKATKLTHAYAKAKQDPSNKGKEEIEVTLSDMPLDAKVLDDPTPFGLIDLSRADKLHGIRFFISPPSIVTRHDAVRLSGLQDGLGLGGGHRHQGRREDARQDDGLRQALHRQAPGLQRRAVRVQRDVQRAAGTLETPTHRFERKASTFDTNPSVLLAEGQVPALLEHRQLEPGIARWMLHATDGATLKS
jgi:hypothetical protein